MIFMECFGELPYDVGYQKKHIRPYGGAWGLLLYPAQQSPCWLNLEIGVFYFIFYFLSSNTFSIIVSYQNEHLQNIIVYCWHFAHPAPVLHWWLKINPKLPKKPKIKNHLISCSKVIIAQNKCLFHHYWGMLDLKVVSEFVRAPKVPLLGTWNGHFWQKCPLLGTKKSYF